MKGPGGKVVQSLFGSKVPGGSALSNKLGPLLDALAKNANEDTTLIRQVSASFNELTACRRNQIAALRRDVVAHRTGRVEAREQAASIKQQAIVDAGVGRNVNARLSARNQKFQVAINDIDTSLPAEQRREAAQIHQTVQTNQRALTTQANAVEMSVNDSGFDISQLWRAAAPRVRAA